MPTASQRGGSVGARSRSLAAGEDADISEAGYGYPPSPRPELSAELRLPWGGYPPPFLPQRASFPPHPFELGGGGPPGWAPPQPQPRAHAMPSASPSFYGAAAAYMHGAPPPQNWQGPLGQDVWLGGPGPAPWRGWPLPPRSESFGSSFGSTWTGPRAARDGPVGLQALLARRSGHGHEGSGGAVRRCSSPMPAAPSASSFPPTRSFSSEQEWSRGVPAVVRACSQEWGRHSPPAWDAGFPDARAAESWQGYALPPARERARTPLPDRRGTSPPTSAWEGQRAELFLPVNGFSESYRTPSPEGLRRRRDYSDGLMQAVTELVPAGSGRNTARSFVARSDPGAADRLHSQLVRYGRSSDRGRRCASPASTAPRGATGTEVQDVIASVLGAQTWGHGQGDYAADFQTVEALEFLPFNKCLEHTQTAPAFRIIDGRDDALLGDGARPEPRRPPQPPSSAMSTAASDFDQGVTEQLGVPAHLGEAGAKRKSSRRSEKLVAARRAVYFDATVPDLKHELRRRGLDSVFCFSRDDLVERLLENDLGE